MGYSYSNIRKRCDTRQDSKKGSAGMQKLILLSRIPHKNQKLLLIRNRLKENSYKKQMQEISREKSADRNSCKKTAISRTNRNRKKKSRKRKRGKIMKRRGRWHKILALGLAAVFTVGALAGCGSKSGSSSSKGYRTLDEIKKSGTIRIGVFSDKSPFGYVDDDGNYAGYDVYFAERLGKDLGVKIKYVSTEAASRVEYLQTGKVDVILANFTVTDERAKQVDFAKPYMNVGLGVVSHDSRVITDMSQIKDDDQVIVISGTTAETYLTKNYPNIKQQKFDTYAAAKSAFENGTGVAWANDNTEVIAFAKANPGYTVGIDSLGDPDTIAPAVTKGNSTLLKWINEEIETLGKENFFHKDYEATLTSTYGADYEDTLVIEGGKSSN